MLTFVFATSSATASGGGLTDRTKMKVVLTLQAAQQSSHMFHVSCHFPGQNILALRDHTATCWCGIHLTTLRGLRARWNVVKVIVMLITEGSECK